MVAGLTRKHEEIKLDWESGWGKKKDISKKDIKDYLKNTTPEGREEIKKFIEELEKKEKNTIEKDDGLTN